jgi:hypothetical protein
VRSQAGASLLVGAEGQPGCGARGEVRVCRGGALAEAGGKEGEAPGARAWSGVELERVWADGGPGLVMKQG